MFIYSEPWRDSHGRGRATQGSRDRGECRRVSCSWANSAGLIYFDIIESWDKLRQIEAVLFSISIFFLIQKLVTADGTYATQSAFSSAPDKKKGSEVQHLVNLRSTCRELKIYDRWYMYVIFQKSQIMLILASWDKNKTTWMQILFILLFFFRTAKPKTESILDPACKPKNMSTSTMSAFRECFVQMRNSISPLDKLAHLLTALKVIVNSVINYFYIMESYYNLKR